MNERPTATASEAILALSRVLAEAPAAGGSAAVAGALVREARALFGLEGAVLLAVDREGRSVSALAADPPVDSAGVASLALDMLTPVRDLLELRLPAAHGSAGDAPLGRLTGWTLHPRTVLFVPVRAPESARTVLALADGRGRPFSAEEQDLAAAFAAAGAGALAQIRLAEEHAQRIAQLSALTRAAKTLNASLDLSRLLADICAEAQAIVGGDAAVIYLGDAGSGLVAEATHSLDTEILGYRLPSGEGLAGRVAQSGRGMLTNDYQGLVRPAADSPFAEVRSALAVPMSWDGALRGVLSVGYMHPHAAATDDLRLLETFAELAAVACRNANAATGLALAARTDALTGCLNHAALHDGLRREIDRSGRSGQQLSLILLDLDGFKQVNERYGHLVGDEVLRRAGFALRSAVRPYDLCARYGGDEFAIVCADTSERAAVEVASRALDRLAAGLSDMPTAQGTGATAGVAAWTGAGASGLLEEADRALLYGKHQDRRGDVLLASELPDTFRPARFRRPGDLLPRDARPADGAGAAGAIHAQRQAERLQKRTRQLVLANALGARLARMTDVTAICNAAADELHRAFGYYLSAIVRVRDDGFVEGAAVRGPAFVRVGQKHWSQPRDAGVIGRALRERRAVLVNDVSLEPAYVATDETVEVRSELVAPIWVGGSLWGAVNVEELNADAFDEEDARRVQIVADQIGSALRTVELYEQLDRAYLATAEALAAALEARDAVAAGADGSIVSLCEAVGRRLGMEDTALRDLRYGAALHDVGKVAVPGEILAKPGRLDPTERAVMQRHPLVAEQIISSIEFLAGVVPLVRHEHERWDGAGYPDGLAGGTIPLGARIIAACDAFRAMTADRPYRPALDRRAAREELVRNAGSQFDPAVVDALLEVLDSNGDGPGGQH